MTTTEKAPAVVLDRVVYELVGAPFYANNIPDSLRQAIEHSKGGGFVAPMWLLAKGFPHSEWYTANSEDHSGPGEFRGVKGHYVVTLHGGVDGNGILTPKITATAIEMHKNGEGDLTPVYAANLSQLFKGNVFADLLQGGMPDGSAIPLYSLEQVMAGENQKHLLDFTRFAIVRTLKQARQTSSGYRNIDELVDAEGKVTNSQVIAYTAGTQEAQNLINNARNSSETGKFGVWHRFNSDKFDSETSQSSVLFLGGDDVNSLFGDSLDSVARFVVVAPKARAAMQAKIEQTLDANTKAALDTGEAFTYNGRLYVPVSAENVKLP